MSEYQDGLKQFSKFLSDWGREGGKKSRRKLTKKQARDMVKARERKRAAGVDFPPSNPSTAEKGHNARVSDAEPETL